MAVNAISYSNSVQSLIFGATTSSDKIKKLMEEFKVTDTGNEKTNLQALYAAMYAFYTTNPTALNQVSETNIPWQPIMNQVGLQSTGVLATDYNAFVQKINNPASQIDNKASLVNSAQSAFVQPQVQPESAQMTGADITAIINRVLILGEKASVFNA